MQFDLIIVGGGAAGFFGAIRAAELKPGLRVVILEKSSKVLSKVRISGGGRCNVTHYEYNPYQFARHYPRGGKALKTLLENFHAQHTVEWFAANGVTLKAEDDGRMFPVTNSSETVIDCFISRAKQLNIKIMPGKAVTGIAQVDDGLAITCSDGEVYSAQKVLVATGGSSKMEAYGIVSDYHKVTGPIPSLFTFNDSEKDFKDLMGISVPHATVKIAGTKFIQQGPLLITHWGLSGPAVIKLSAWAAEYLHLAGYSFTALVNWLGQLKEDEVRTVLLEWKVSRSRQKIFSGSLFALPQRLSHRLCALADIEEDQRWDGLSHKKINKLVELLIRYPFQINGKTTFKEEFVTCGGVDLEEVNLSTMESKKIKNLFFAGEVLNIDGETGGFNFQNAWTTGFVAARNIAGAS